MNTKSLLAGVKRSGVLVGMIALLVVLASCTPGVMAVPAAQAPAATDAPPAPPTTAPAAVPAAASAGTLIKTAMDEKFGSFLVDEKGMTLYLYTKDTKNVSNCYDQCATNWPLLFTTDAPQAGDGVNASLLGTTTRTDGKLQVTYNGWPLYYWIKDTKAGNTSGQDVGGVWFLVSPLGEMIETPAASEMPDAPAKTANVSIQNFSYGAPLTVQVGTTVTWTNADQMHHTVTAASGSFDSGDLGQGATFSYTFTKEGTYDYTCTYHPNMLGQVIVTK